MSFAIDIEFGWSVDVFEWNFAAAFELDNGVIAFDFSVLHYRLPSRQSSKVWNVEFLICGLL